MVHINAAGELQSARSFQPINQLVELFWAFVNMIGLFFSTIFGDPRKKIDKPVTRSATISGRGGGGSGGGGGGGGPSRRNIHGFADLNRGAGSIGGCPGGGCGM